MARLVWSPSPNFEFGVDHVVLYVDGNVPVPWNGVTSIVETKAGNDFEPQYFDGQKYLDISNFPSFQLKMTTLTEPPLFNLVLGMDAIVPGFFLTKQPKTSFGLTYRTNVGSDLGTKIHVVYNLTVKLANVTYGTITETVDPKVKTWDLVSTPIDFPNGPPTSHFIFDSTKIAPGLFSDLQNVIYGDMGQEPRLPTVSELTEWSST